MFDRFFDADTNGDHALALGAEVLTVDLTEFKAVNEAAFAVGSPDLEQTVLCVAGLPPGWDQCAPPTSNISW